MDITDMQVVLAEPSSTQQKIITSCLNELGLKHVTPASSGEIALSEIGHTDPELVIGNMYLPDMTGTKLLKKIRENTRFESLPFILISGEKNWKLLDPIKQAGCAAILPKPFALEELRCALLATADGYQRNDLKLDNYVVEDLNVLIVDDSRMARNHFKRVLKNMGIEKFAEANDGCEAVELLNEQYFDLVVTDYNMPEMDGQQLTSFIRDNSSQQTVPIIMVTSEKRDSRLSAVMSSGVSAICDKPFDPSTVRSLLAGIFSE